jgi:hypothetical protein
LQAAAVPLAAVLLSVNILVDNLRYCPTELGFPDLFEYTSNGPATYKLLAMATPPENVPPPPVLEISISLNYLIFLFYLQVILGVLDILKNLLTVRGLAVGLVASVVSFDIIFGRVKVLELYVIVEGGTFAGGVAIAKSLYVAGPLDVYSSKSGTPSTSGQYLRLSTSTFTDNSTAASGYNDIIPEFDKLTIASRYK